VSSRHQDPTTAPATASAPGPTRGRSRRRRLTALVAAGLLTLMTPALPAGAHDELSGSTPADGASVEIPPAAVELTFTEPPLALGSQVQVTGPDGSVVNAGDLTITDTVVSQPLAADLPAGEYAVVWRVTSSDGHPISGELGFTAQGAAAQPEPAPTPEPTSGAVEPTPGATAEPTTGSSAPATEPAPESGDAAPDAPSVDEPAGGATPWVVGIAVVVVVGGALWWVARRRAGAGQQG
jgi:methionine-rich copper-binding protein CopC